MPFLFKILSNSFLSSGNNFCDFSFTIFSMKTQIHFVGVSGSLRKGSFNTMLLNATMQLIPEDVTMEITSIADIPNYNADLDVPSASQRPAPAQRFRDALTKAQAIVIVSP
jgi:chromate reductase